MGTCVYFSPSSSPSTSCQLCCSHVALHIVHDLCGFHVIADLISIVLESVLFDLVFCRLDSLGRSASLEILCLHSTSSTVPESTKSGALLDTM